MKMSKRRETFVRYALPYGAGALLAAAFLGVLPEALEGQDAHEVVWLSLGGFLAFFVLERLLGWFHHHHHDDDVDVAKDKTHISLVVVGDTLHNAIDGVAIGAAFLVSAPAGIATSIAVAAHEIPQEVGDFGILLGKGMKASRVLLINLISAFATVVMAVVTFILGAANVIDPTPLLAVAAGLFIYIAASDLIPDIHEKPRAEGNIQSLMLLVGVVTVSAVIWFLPHGH